MKKFNWLWFNKWVTLALLLIPLLFSFVSEAQIKINGKVTNKSGKGIIAVSVAIRNTTLGTATDADGHYVLSVGKSLHPLSGPANYQLH